MSNVRASCARGKIKANNMADIEKEILLQANLFLLLVLKRRQRQLQNRTKHQFWIRKILMKRQDKLNFSDASRGTKLCSCFNFYFLYNTWKDQLYQISGSKFYEWVFGPEKFSGLLRNRRPPWSYHWLLKADIFPCINGVPLMYVKLHLMLIHARLVVSCFVSMNVKHKQ